MILAIDCGNTNTVFALYSFKNGIKQECCWRINNNSKRTADSYFPWLLQMLTLSNIKIDNITGVCIASVVTETLFNIKNLIKKYIKINPLVIDNNIFDLGLKVNIDNPEEAGADRLVNSFAAKCLNLSPAIIIDFGTATTFDLVGEDGSYNGGIIAPGVNLSLEALYLAAARLPRITLKPLSNEKSIIGKNTINAMESGIYWGYVSMIEGLINKIKLLNEYKNYKVIATGGLSELFKKSLPCIDYIKEDLTLIGLVNLYLNNLKNKN
ncbi:type III pantothenate kinase [Alphaproteobacteria bacterium]|nr:type III pantothenate kinase [Alphaproteobacteria bacterium]